MAGRPPLFDSPEDLDKSIEDYIANVQNGVASISGLAYYLGFESRQSFYDYEKRGEYSYIIKRARLFIEMCYELRLSGNSNTGAIFALKNMGWSDKQEIDQKTTIKDERIDDSTLTDSDRDYLADLQLRLRRGKGQD